MDPGQQAGQQAAQYAAQQAVQAASQAARDSARWASEQARRAGEAQLRARQQYPTRSRPSYIVGTIFKLLFAALVVGFLVVVAREALH
jgi:cobalamin biosynthesis Mg chelatase CobN